MQRVSSPTCACDPIRPARWWRAAVIGVLAAALALGTAVPSSAKGLDDQRKEVRQAMVEAKKDVSDSKKAVKSATADLVDSQTKLDKAQAALDQLNVKLDAAKTAKSQADTALATAKKELQAATTAASQASDDVDQQLLVIGVAIRTQYQRQTPLEGLGAVLGSDTPAELAQRLQWSTTIFDNTSAQLDRLEQLQAQLATAQQAKATAESNVAKQQKQAATQLKSVQSLTNQAAAQKTEVAKLVAQNKKAKSAAEADLLADQKQYDKLTKKDAQISAAIKKAAEEERRKAAAAKKKLKQTTVSSTTVKSSSGFVRPVPGGVGSPYGMRYHPILHVWRMHRGEDLHASCGTPIKAMADGTVTSTIPVRSSGGLGNYTIINYGHYKGKSLSSGYAHQSKFLVHPGQKVKAGQVVGLVGTTGLSTGCHLHLQMYENGNLVNPARYVS